MMKFIFKHLLKLAKKIRPEFYKRYEAEQVMIDYGMKPFGANGWGWWSEKKSVMVYVGDFIYVDSQYIFHCKMLTMYGQFIPAYLPLKKNTVYTVEQLKRILETRNK